MSVKKGGELLGRAFALAILLACTSLALGAEKPIQLSTADVAPWGFASNTGQPAGLLVEFQRELAARVGLPMRDKLSPYPRVIHDLASGKVDLAVMFVSPQAEQVGRSLGRVVDMGVVAIVPATAPEYRSLEDFAGLRVGYVRGSKYGPQFDDNPRIQRIGVSYASQGLRMLMKGRLDVMVATEQALAFGFVRLDAPAEKFKVALQVSAVRADLYATRLKAMAPWMPRVERALQGMRDDGALRRIFYEHGLWQAADVCLANGYCLASQKPGAASEP